MRIYSSPPRGHCASCEALIPGRPIYQRDEAYCCIGCAADGPCVCSYEADLAEDGVDGLGLLSAPEPVTTLDVEREVERIRRVRDREFRELVAR